MKYPRKPKKIPGGPVSAAAVLKFGPRLLCDDTDYTLLILCPNTHLMSSGRSSCSLSLDGLYRVLFSFFFAVPLLARATPKTNRE